MRTFAVADGHESPRGRIDVARRPTLSTEAFMHVITDAVDNGATVLLVLRDNDTGKLSQFTLASTHFVKAAPRLAQIAIAMRHNKMVGGAERTGEYRGIAVCVAGAIKVDPDLLVSPPGGSIDIRSRPARGSLLCALARLSAAGGGGHCVHSPVTGSTRNHAFRYFGALMRSTAASARPHGTPIAGRAISPGKARNVRRFKRPSLPVNGRTQRVSRCG
jgi:hypothetical protein